MAVTLLACNKVDRIKDGYCGYINVDGERVLDLLCCINDDLSQFDMGKLNWNLFISEQDKDFPERKECPVSISLSPSGIIRKVYLEYIPHFGALYCLGSDNYNGETLEKGEDNTYTFTNAKYLPLDPPSMSRIDGAIEVQELSYPADGSSLRLSLAIKTEHEIQIVFFSQTATKKNLWGRM